jgi:hypothetical protein
VAKQRDSRLGRLRWLQRGGSSRWLAGGSLGGGSGSGGKRGKLVGDLVVGAAQCSVFQSGSEARGSAQQRDALRGGASGSLARCRGYASGQGGRGRGRHSGSVLSNM